MNRVIEDYKVPGYKTLMVIVPREVSKKEGEYKHALQLELNLNTNVLERKE